MFAAYVDENSQVVEAILQQALQSGIINQFVGYQQGEKEVFNQLAAVWYVLQRRGIKYSNIVTPSGVSTKVLSQSVRPIEHSFGYQQANCVDGSVLLASIYRKIGLHVFLVTVPSHCFMGVYADDARSPQKAVFIETTDIGKFDLRQVPGSPTEAELARRKISRDWLGQAIKDATAKYRQLLQEQSFSAKSGSSAQSHLYDIDHLRELGINPL